MSALPTRILRLVVRAPDGQPVPLAGVTAQLVDARGVVPTFDLVADGAVVPGVVVGVTDGAGSVDLQLWPNARGTQATKYRLQARVAEVLLLNALVYVPDGAAGSVVSLADVVVDGPVPPLTQLEAGLLQVTQAQLRVAADAAATAEARRVIEDLIANFDPGSGGQPARYTHTQSIAAAVWTVPHNLGRRPAITVIDSLGNVVMPDVRYVGLDIAQITHGAPMTGVATCV